MAEESTPSNLLAVTESPVTEITPLNFDNAITPETVEVLEKDLSEQDLVSLIFLLDDVPERALQVLKISFANGIPTSTALSDWCRANSADEEWRLKLLEGFFAVQNFQVIHKLGFCAENLQAKFSFDPFEGKYVDEIRKMLYWVCEHIELHEFELFISEMKRDLRNPEDLDFNFTNSNDEFLEIYVLILFSFKYIINDGGHIDIDYFKNVLKRMDKLDMANELMMKCLQVACKRIRLYLTQEGLNSDQNIIIASDEVATTSSTPNIIGYSALADLSDSDDSDAYESALSREGSEDSDDYETALSSMSDDSDDSDHSYSLTDSDTMTEESDSDTPESIDVINESKYADFEQTGSEDETNLSPQVIQNISNVTIPVIRVSNETEDNNCENSASPVVHHQSEDAIPGPSSIEAFYKRFFKIEHGGQLSSYDIEDVNNPGLIIVLNQSEFEKSNLIRLDNRTGTEIDEEVLRNTFERELKMTFVLLRNLKAEDIVKSIKHALITNFNPKRHSMAFVCILSHGVSGYIFGTDCKMVSVKKLHNLLVEYRDLNYKPKVLIIEACQENKLPGFPIFVKNEPIGNFIGKRDVLICMSTMPGLTALRSKSMGTFYIQSLCNYLVENKDKHFLEIVTFVHNYISKGEFLQLIMGKPMVPQLESSLTKLLHVYKM